MKKSIISLLLVLLLCSCPFLMQDKTDDIQWEDEQGNSIYYKWDIFGDASVNYKNSKGDVIKLRNYAYSDSHERMNIFVSQNSRNVCLLVYKTTDSKYKTGSALHIIELKEDKTCVVKETVVDNVLLSDKLMISDEQVTYYDKDGNCYYYNFSISD